MVLQRGRRTFNTSFKTDSGRLDYGRILLTMELIGALEVAILPFGWCCIGCARNGNAAPCTACLRRSFSWVLGEAHSLELRHGLLQKLRRNQFCWPGCYGIHQSD